MHSATGGILVYACPKAESLYSIIAQIAKSLTNRGNYVLIADDNADSCERLSTIVESLGLQVVAVSNGIRALDQVHSEAPSLILLDMLMPNLDGFSVVTQLQANEETRHTPVVLISAIIDRGIRAMPGVAGVIPKASFNLADVEKQIRELLNLSVISS